MNNRLIKSNDAGGGGACTNTVDLYNPFPDGGGVALYQLNGDATDVSGNYDGTATNVTYGAGQFGQAGVFNGSTSYVTLPITQSNDISISAWVKIEDLTRQHQIVSYDLGGVSSNRCLQFRVEFDQTVSAYWFSGTKAVTTSSLSQGVWAHVVATWQDNGTQKIYFNGVEEGSNPATTRTNFPNLFIGKRNISGSTVDDFLGSIDQVRIFNRALRPYEVEALYTEEYCTPTIVPSEHFNTVLYTGNGTSQSITGVGFQPDFVWTKSRSTTADNNVVDSVRGLGDNVLKALSTNLTDAENTTTSNNISSLDSDGFTVQGAGSRTNSNGQDYVAWNFKAGGAAVTNTDGTITSQVSANTEAGFSVVSWTGTGSAATIGHGLGTTPAMVIVKSRDGVRQWFVYHKQLNNGVNTGQYFLSLNLTDPEYYNINSVWNGLAPTSSIINLGGSANFAGEEIAYCFAEVEGFSNFGSYVGTGASGNTVVTGFEPAFVILKGSSPVGSSWVMIDNKRGDSYLLADTSGSEVSSDIIDFTANGFVFQGSNMNTSSREYIYMAFAADPTTVEPTLEDSFNTVTYTGNGGTQSITGVGFQPDFVWAKNRDQSDNHRLADSVRGATNYLVSNLTNAESTSANNFTSFDSDGFSIGTAASINTNGEDYVAWNWKGAELPAINSNGSIPSVVSANPAAGFSIVSYTGNGANGTVGHGLGVTPNIVLTKRRNSTSNWSFNGNIGGLIYGTNKLALNDTAGIAADTNEVLAANSNNFTAGTSGAVGASGGTYVAYCFAEVAGFSKFGSYTGNGSTSGQTIEVGFEPAFLIIKSTSQASDWFMWDNKRSPTNERDNRLKANTSDAETISTNGINFDSTSFRMSGENFNNLNRDFIYMAFANQF